jgi:hypothetical protein
MEIVSESGLATASLKITENQLITGANNAVLDPRNSASLVVSPSLIAFDTSDNLNDTANSAYNLISGQGTIGSIVERAALAAHMTTGSTLSMAASSAQTNSGLDQARMNEERGAGGSAAQQQRHDSDSESEEFFTNFNIKRFSSTRRDLD